LISISDLDLGGRNL